MRRESASAQDLNEQDEVSYIDKLDSRLSSASDAVYVISICPSAPRITVNWLLDLISSGTINDVNNKTGLLLSRLDIDLVDGFPLIYMVANTVGKKYLKPRNEEEHLLVVDLSEEYLRRCSVNLIHRVKKEAQLDILGIGSSKQKILLKELETSELLCCQERSVLFGMPNTKLYAGQSILQICKREGIVTQYFPVHQPTELNDLKQSWVTFGLTRQPIEKIRKYFGETIAFYFSFIEFYTFALIFPAMLGIIDSLFNDRMSPTSAVLNGLWTVIFLKYWKRRSNELAYEWGTLDVINYEPPRPSFRGKTMGVDPVTGKETPVYPKQKTWLKEYGVSLPVIGLCLWVAFKVMMFYFSIEHAVVDYYREHPNTIGALVATNLPGIVYAIAVAVMNVYYRLLAHKLNEWENHRSQESHENHLITKLILFEFANNFMSIFYVAFVMRDMVALRWQVGTMLIIYQMIDTIQEILIPMMNRHYAEKELNFKPKKIDDSNFRILTESKMPVYEDTYYDFLELYIQFGYVFLFASVFPLAPLLALINNIVEMRSDAYKLCTAYQRPHQRAASGIHGAWLKAFEVMSMLSVATNCALLAVENIDFDRFQVDDLANVLSTVGLEHFAFLLMLVINYVVPDVPRKVRLALLRDEYVKR